MGNIITLAAVHELVCGLRAEVKSQGFRVEARLKAIATSVDRLSHKTQKEFYSVPEFSHLVNLSPYTVREACREGRLAADKTLGGRANKGEWRIAHAEYVRFQKDGWLPSKQS